MLEVNKQLEDEADRFATDYLIPPAALRSFSPTKYTSDAEIVEFAKSINIHPVYKA